MKLRFIAVGFLVVCFVFVVRGHAQSFSWPTPSSSPSPFVGVTSRPTAVATPGAQVSLCFEDFNPTTYTILNPVVCGQNLTTAAGNVVATGISLSNSGAPVGPWPSTVTLVVNGVKYTSVPVNQTNGIIGYALIPGVQLLEVIVPSAATYVGTSANVITH